MIAGPYAHSIVVTDDEAGIPIDYDDHARVLAAMTSSESSVTVTRVGYYGVAEGKVTISTARIIRVEENSDRGRF